MASVRCRERERDMQRDTQRHTAERDAVEDNFLYAVHSATAINAQQGT